MRLKKVDESLSYLVASLLNFFKFQKKSFDDVALFVTVFVDLFDVFAISAVWNPWSDS